MTNRSFPEKSFKPQFNEAEFTARSIVNLVEEWFRWLGLVAYRACVDGPGMALFLNGLNVIRCRDRWSRCMLRAMADRAVNTAVTSGIFEQHPRFLELKVGFALLMTTATGWFVDPGAARGLTNGGHVAVAILADDAG